ncbi:MAG: ribonuclease HII [Campylobacterales bacterium]|nr:ribonuclease HII [Campylobacterales bacterium]
MSPLCGIDEAGRGPIAGPLMMAGVILNAPIEGLNDSKKLSERRREALYEQIIHSARYHIVRFDASQIDEIGISRCLRQGLEQIMHALAPADFLFDGNSTFGAQGLRTQIKADAEVAQVSAASILAKVTRDREMAQMDALYPHYDFKSHKGYGTALHVSMIQKYGYCPIHRKSFRLKALQPSLFD